MISPSFKFDTIFDLYNLDEMRKEIKSLKEGRAGREFELFAVYVFERAGFRVHDVAQGRSIPGIDFELFPLNSDTTKPLAYVQAKHVSQTVGIDEVMRLGGVIPPGPQVVKILITSNRVSDDAKRHAEQYNKFMLLDIDTLVRYIRLIRGTRYTEDSTTTVFPDLLTKADALQFRTLTETKVLTVANDKGGVGKTTSVINIGTLLANQGLNVLLVDMDAQANLTLRMGLTGIAAQPKPRSMMDYFFEKYSLPELIRPTDFEHLWIIPSAQNLNLAAKGVNEWTKQALTFASDLHSPSILPPPYHAAKFDWIIIDTPTTDEYRIRLALAASHFVVAPAIPSPFATSGLQVLLSSVDTIQGLMGRHVDLAGCFLTQCNEVNGRTMELFRDTMDVLRNRGVQLFKTTIPRSQSVETAHLKQKSLFGRAKLSTVAEAYRTLVEKELTPYVNSHTN